MARSRLQLHSILESIVGEGNKVYFQPPANISMTYPCIVYELDSQETQFADNNPMIVTNRYQVTHIDPDPDDSLAAVDKLAHLPMSSFSSAFVVDNLNHRVFNVYF